MVSCCKGHSRHLRVMRGVVGFILLILLAWAPGDTINAGDAGDFQLERLTITADTMYADRKKQVVRFEGNVVAEQKDFTMHAAKLLIYYKEEEIKEIVAMGDVVIRQPGRVATSRKAVYNRIERSIVLTGSPKVEQGKDVVTGEKITIYIDQEKSIVEGGANKRVKAVIYPKEQETSGQKR